MSLISPISTLEVIFHLSVWETYDIGYSQYQLVEDYIRRHNEALTPSARIEDSMGRQRKYFAGKLRAPQTMLAQKLIWLAMTQLEETRKAAVAGDAAARQKYMLYYREDVDSIPVTTNRSELRNFLGQKNGLATIWRHIDQLKCAGVVLSKANTSRQRREVIEEDGYRTIIVEMAENGRGDFILWINSQLFKRKIAAPAAGANPAIGNPQISKLQQQYLVQKETQKREENNPEEQGNEGVASPHGQLTEAIASNKGKRNEASKKKLVPAPATGGKNAEKSRANGVVLPVRDPEPFSLERYRRDLRRSERIRAYLPEKMMEYWVLILYHQLHEMLYQHLPADYVAAISSHVKGLLELHIRRIEISDAKTHEEQVQKAASRVSRAIHQAKLWLDDKGAEFNLYEPLTYLRIDDGMKNGLRNIVDKWLPAEDKRRALRAEANSRLMNWQQAEAYAEDLFRDVMFTLKKSGYFQSHAVFQEARMKLDRKFNKIGLAETTQTKVRKAFIERCINIFQAIQKATFQEEDTTWSDFLRYRKAINI